MSEKEIREGMEKISGGTDTKQGNKSGVKFPALKYGAPCILPNKPGCIMPPPPNKLTHLAYGGPCIGIPEEPVKPTEQPDEPLLPADPEK